LISEEELAQRRRTFKPPVLENQTPWQEIYRSTVGQLDTGGCMELAVKYHDLVHTKGLPRDSH
jgi:dihydroxy-acid dehydratase